LELRRYLKLNIIIRQKTEKNYEISETVVEKAFKNEVRSDHKEQFLVAKLRKSNVFVPELSLVAEINEEIVGHIMFTKLLIKEGEMEYESLALAPVSILPEYQNKGIGSKLDSSRSKNFERNGLRISNCTWAS
jgi:predicted N-acetyltransferase YhbS